MNDLDLLCDMRADVPSPSPARLAAGRNRLLASAAHPPKPRHQRRIFVPAGLVTAAAGALVAVVIANSGTAPAHPVPGTRLTLASQVLQNASATAAKRAAVEPGPHQWFDTTFVIYGYGQGTGKDETWYRFDGVQYAVMVNGHLDVHTQKAVAASMGSALDAYDSNATPQTAYEALASLPSSSTALLAAVDHQLSTTSTGSIEMFAPPGSPPAAHTRAEKEFAYLLELLWNGVDATPPAAEAAVYRAMSTIPGVSTQAGITDVAGRPAIGVSANGGYTQLLLDPQTYEVIGLRGTSTGTTPTGVTAGIPPKGTVIASMAWATVKPVRGPGSH
jgi:hypothetical protein